MTNGFKRFDGCPNGKSREKARITLSRRRFFTLNAWAFESIGSPVAVELFFDEDERRIGILPCDPDRKNAFPIREEIGKAYHVVYAGAFCQHFSISPTRTILFHEPSITIDGMLVLDMKNTINVGRGSR